jgi:beta-glucosidase
VIAVLINTRPLATVWMDEHIPAIIEAWEPGMAGGRAVAEAVFGDLNPGGRLSVTVPRSAGHLQAVYNHRPAYTEFDYAFDTAEPLYPFGHGLSYTTFEYSDLEIPETLSPGENLKVRVTVENTGKRAGDEVVLAFLNDVYSSVTTPVRELKAFTRISLKPGESRRVAFEIPFERLALLDKDLQPVVEPGRFEVYVGDLEGGFEVAEK